MLYFSRWKMILVIAAAICGIYFSFPNFLTSQQLAKLPDFITKSRLVLGLDLQGGSHLLLEIDKKDVLKSRLNDLSREIRQVLFTKAGIRHSRSVAGNSIIIKLIEPAKNDQARKILDQLDSYGSLKELQTENPRQGEFVVTISLEGIDNRIGNIIAESIEVIRRRIDELGTTEPTIQRQGNDRILVQVPGFNDPQQLKAVIGQTAKMTFHMVKGSETSLEQADKLTPVSGTVLVPLAEDPNIVLRLEDVAALSGEYLTNAQPSFDQRTNEPIVTFRFDAKGARIFDQITRDNVGKRFAIVLDDKIIMAPVINQHISGGSGQISGSFTIDEANNLAILLRAGALPAKLTFVEERSVGPSLGIDSIEAGTISAIIGLIAVVVFMALSYGLFGIFGDIALGVNILMLIGVMSLLQATLTLPGIAGIILTIGMAVDANVLIFERIREELKGGRSVIKAVDTGYAQALGTIMDANITTFIAAVVLFTLGSGPIRGFAITLAIGIITSVFSAFTFSRLLAAIWIAKRRPKKLVI